jgi:hypothetical protein
VTPPFRELHFLYAVQMRPLFTSLAFNAPLPIDQLKGRLSGEQLAIVARGAHVHPKRDADRLPKASTLRIHVRPARSIFSNAPNLRCSAIAVFVRSP